MTAVELMEQGIRAYTRGQLGEAERCWRDVLAVDPANARAQSYLELLVGKLVHGTAATPAQGAPVPLPAPAAVPAAAPPGTARDADPVRLPAPPAASWLSPPITLPPSPIPSLEPAQPESPTAPPLSPALSPLSWEGETTAAISLSTPTPTPIPLSISPSPPPPPPPPLSTDSSIPKPGERVTLSDYAPSPWDQGPASGPAVVLDDGVGLDLATVAEQSGLRSLVPEMGGREAPAGRQKPQSPVEIWMEGARELFALGDFSGSLEMIEKILKIDPSHVEAREYLKQNEATLIAMYESKLGPAAAIPRLAIKPEEVMWLNLDHRAGFLLAQIDGTVSYDDLFALSGLPRLDTARILASLLQEGVITP